MLFPQEKRNVSDSPAPQQPAPQQPIYVQQGSGVKIPILFGAVIALVGASVYLFYQLSKVRAELAETRDSLSAEISKLNETSNVTTQTSRRTIESLKKDLDKARAQAAQLSGRAQAEAT